MVRGLLSTTALLAVALALIGPAAPAQAAPWVEIKGPDRIKASKQLGYRILCREACRVAVTARLTWPGRPNLLSTIQGRFRAGESRAHLLTLNNAARVALKANLRQAKLQVVVRARNLDRGASGIVRRGFEFRP